MKKNKAKWAVILLVVVLTAIVIDIAVSLSVPTPSRCLEIPIKFAMEYPNCTNRLIEAANLTNIRIVSPGTLEARRHNTSKIK